MPEIALTRDVTFASPNGVDLTLDIATSTEPTPEPSPVIIYIHGGAWMGGTKDDFNPNGPMAHAGFFTLNINYRLAPDFTWPAQIDDVVAAVKWVRANAAKYNIDPNRIGVWGHSAGGHLACLLGTLADENGHSYVQAAIGLSAATDFTASHFPEGVTWPEDQTHIVGQLLGENWDLAPGASPIHQVRPGLPPFMLIHGEQDMLLPVGQAEAFYNALKAQGCDATLIKIAQAEHGFDAGAVQWPLVMAMCEGFFASCLLG